MSWSAALEREFERRKPPPPVHSSNLRVAMYRPFFKQHLYFTKFWALLTYPWVIFSLGGWVGGRRG